MKMKYSHGGEITYLFVLLTSVCMVSCANQCNGYTKWIYISSGGYGSEKQDASTNPTVTNYTSLEKAMRSENLNNTCIVLNENIVLKEDIVRQYIFKLLLTSDPSNPIEVKCDIHTPVGIAFTKSKHICISNINFNYCGGERSIKRTCDGGNCLNVSTALYFQDSVDISIKNVLLNSSVGYGVTIVDSNTVLMSDVTIQYSNNFQFGTNERDNISAGGLYVEYSPNYLAYRNTLVLKDCDFIHNYASKSITSLSKNLTLDNTLPFGKGGAITVLYLGNATENVFNCSGGVINRNQAIIGGGVYLYFSKNAINNSVTFNDFISVENNIAFQKGGGISISQNENNNAIDFEDVYFLSNSAYIGGCAFSITNVFSPEFINNRKKNDFKKISFRKCNFVSCQGMVGAAMYFQRTYIGFMNLKVSDSRQTTVNDKGKGHGAVYALDSTIKLHGNTSITHNNGTAFILNYSKMKVSNRVSFVNNTGYNGGALSLYGDSQMILTANVVVEFYNNTAKNKGGAIYSTKGDEALIPLVSIELLMYRCFITFEGEKRHNFKGSVTFHNNHVKKGFGEDIFTSSLKYCREANVSSFHEAIAKWNNFNFTNKENNSIVTDPIHMELYSDDAWNDVYPGKLIRPKIYLRDERGNHVQAEAIITFSNNLSVEQNKGLIVGQNSETQLRILGDQNIKYNVTITTTTGLYLSKTLENMYLKFCPFGFKYRNKSRKCLCDYIHNRANGIAECNETQLLMYHNLWVQTNKDKKSNENLSSYSCPSGYCRKCDTNNTMNIYCNFYTSNQCRRGRDQLSRLCSKCEIGKSVTIGGSQECENCQGTYQWILITFLIMFGSSVFIIILVLLRLDIMSYYIGGCLYSYQMLYFLYAPKLDPNDPFLSIIKGFFDFTFWNSPYPYSCLFHGMNNLQKMAYNYIIPFWMLIFSAMVYHLSKSDNRDNRNWFTKGKLLNAFTIIGLMIYTDLTKISFMILDWVEIEGNKYSYIYADSRYGRDEHLPYFIFAIIIIVLFTFCIPMYFINSALRRLRRNNEGGEALPLPAWSLEYKLSYFLKKERYWFLFYYFASRVGIFLIAIFVQNGPLQTALVTLASLLIFAIFSLVSPYAEKYENYAETFLLAVLTVIGILNLGLQTVYLEKHVVGIEWAIRIFSYFPVIVVVTKVVQKELISRYCIKDESDGGVQMVQVPYRARVLTEST